MKDLEWKIINTTRIKGLGLQLSENYLEYRQMIN